MFLRVTQRNAGVFKGRDGVIRSLALMNEAIEFKPDVKNIIAISNNRVLVVYEAAVQARASKKMGRGWGTQIFQFNQQYQVARVQSFFDSATSAELIKGTIGVDVGRKSKREEPISASAKENMAALMAWYKAW
jgi:hypothetical protein